MERAANSIELVWSSAQIKKNTYSVKPVHHDHPLGRKIVAIVDEWSLFRGHLYHSITRSQHDGRSFKVVVS